MLENKPSNLYILKYWKKYLITIIDAPNGIWTRVTSSTGSYDRPLHYRGFPSLSFRDINNYHASGPVVTDSPLLLKVSSETKVNKSELISNTIDSESAWFSIFKNRREMFRVQKALHNIRTG